MDLLCNVTLSHFIGQRLYRTQIIWVCSDIWVFSVLDNRLLADNLSQLPKVSIWLRKVGYVVNTRFFGLLFYSDLTQTNEIWLRQMRFDSDKWDLTQNIYALLSRSGICRKYALFWSPFLLRFDSDKWDSTQTWLRYLCKKMAGKASDVTLFSLES